MADVAALFRLHRARPEKQRPYRAWGYPLVPALYIAANGAVALALLVRRPRECAIGLAMLTTGLPFEERPAATARKSRKVGKESRVPCAIGQRANPVLR